MLALHAPLRLRLPRIRIRRYKLERAVYAALAGLSAFYAGTWTAYAGFALGVLSWSVASISDRMAEGAAIAAARLRATRPRITDRDVLATIDQQLDGGRALVECSGKLAGRTAALQVASTLLTVIMALASPGGPLAAWSSRFNDALTLWTQATWRWLFDAPWSASPVSAASFALFATAYTIGWRGIYRPSRWAHEARRVGR